MDDFLETLADSRNEAPELWAELKRYRFQDQYHLVRVHRRFVTWGLCELLCKESSRLAAVDPSLAVESAELAVLVSDLLKEGQLDRARRLYQLRGYAWAHDGNARRVMGDLRNADESFSIADAWWEAGEAGVVDVMGYEPVLLDHKASLRIAQRRFPEAFSLLDSLYSLHTGGGGADHQDAHLAGRALVKKALALVEMEEPELANELLHEAEPLVDAERDPRLFLCLRHNLLWNLATAGTPEDCGQAHLLLPEVATLCRELGNPLDLVRLSWTEGRIVAGLGRTEQAVQLFQKVRQEFVERGMAYDAAMVTLDLTAVYAQEGCTSEVKRLSLEVAEIFRSQDVPREALAALLFFQKAAERERATATLTREIAAFLGNLWRDPGLRFDSSD